MMIAPKAGARGKKEKRTTAKNKVETSTPKI